MIQNIQYITHSLLQSKYRLILNIVIYALIYISINNAQIASCMMEGNEIPEVAEAKPITRPNVEQLISRNIDSYIGDKALILSQQEEIARLAKDIEFHKELLKAIDTEGRLDLLVSEYGDTRSRIDRVCEKYNKSLYEVLP